MTRTKPRAAAAASPPIPDLDLRATLDAYPGGLSALAVDAGVAYTNLRRFRDGGRKKTPWDTIRKLVKLGEKWAEVPGCNLAEDELRARFGTLYQAAKLIALDVPISRRKPGTTGRRVGTR